MNSANATDSAKGGFYDPAINRPTHKSALNLKLIMTADINFPHVVSCNGDLIPPSMATLSVLGETLYGAWGVYESIQLCNGVAFHLDDHLQRLLDSAKQIDLPLAGNLEQHRNWLQALLKAEAAETGQPIQQATIRLFAVGPEEDTGPRSFLWLIPFRPPAPTLYTQGVGAVTYVGERTLPNTKSLNTLVNTLARHKANQMGEHEGLLVDRQGNLREGASSNFYGVMAGKIVVPPACDILEGVTLHIVLRLAAEAGIDVERRPLPLAERAHWQEAFLTSTSRHVLPLVRLDGHPIGEGTPGPITQEIHRRFEDYFHRFIAAQQPVF